MALKVSEQSGPAKGHDYRLRPDSHATARQGFTAKRFAEHAARAGRRENQNLGTVADRRSDRWRTGEVAIHVDVAMTGYE